MITLEATYLCWILDKGDDPQDQCAHGQILLRINNTSFVTPENGTWSMPSAALNLMRTLDGTPRPHDELLGGHVIPCCGHFPLMQNGRLLNLGCDTGINIDVTFDAGSIRVTGADGASEVLPAAEWAKAVRRFARQIDAFYRTSAPKVALDEDDPNCEGWREFWREWRTRLSAEQAAH